VVSTEPDPRIARTRRRVLDAALDLLAEKGFAALSVEGVAERSGVAKSTIYRHWPGLPALLLDAFGTVNPEPPAFASAGSLRTDLRTFLSELTGAITASRWGSLLAALVDAAERDAQFSELTRNFVEQRRGRLAELLRAAQDRGDLAAHWDPDLLAGLVGGNLFYRRLVSREPLDEGVVEDLVAIVERL
jgi:AcrR family transcriptional regulator